MSDGWYETLAAIGGITVITVTAVYKGDHELAAVGIGALGAYLAAKGIALGRGKNVSNS